MNQDLNINKPSFHLISNKTIKSVEGLLSKDSVRPATFNDSLCGFYTDYIESNLFVIILLFIFVGFLVYKYFEKQEKDKNKLEEFYPTFNPGIPTADQQSFVNYLPNNEKLNFDGLEGNYLSRNDICPPKPIYEEFPPIILPPQQRDDFVGTQNTYANAQDQIFPHPWGWDTRFNTSTGDAVDFMAGANRKSLDDMAHIIFDKERNLLNAVGYDGY